MDTAENKSYYKRRDLIDAIGNVHQEVATGATPRIVCLVPSITELLCSLGLAEFIVGRTGFCIHPKEVVQAIPKIGGTKDVNIEKIRRLAPTHLIVNIDENEKPTVDLLAQFIPHVVVTHPNHPRDNFDLFRLLGGIFRCSERAESLCCELELALNLLSQSKPDPQRVVYCIWKDPWMTVSAETYIAAMLSLRGWQQWQAPHDARRYPSFTWDQVDLSQIDVVLLSTEPFSFQQSHALELQTQIGKPVLVVDGEMLSWYGSRVIQGVEYLRTLRIQ